ncbi:MAG: hypothetical protein ACYSUP_07380 [Planctomycetota bacterium]
MKTTSRVAVAAASCAICTLASGLLFCASTCAGIHEVGGVFVAGMLLFSAIAFLLGIIAVLFISIHHKLLKGYIYAMFAILLASPFILGMYTIHSVTRARAEREKANTGLHNLRVLGRALLDYAGDHEGYLPPADQWCDVLLQDNSALTKGNFRHPRGQELGLVGMCHFAFNKNLSELRLADIRNDVVLIFEADGDWNLSGAGELLRSRRTTVRDEFYVGVLFVDQTEATFWFEQQAVTRVGSGGMSYRSPRWKP